MTTTTSTERRPPLNVYEAADYLGISVRFVRRLVSERRIAFLKVGRYVRFDPEVLDQFLTDSIVPVSEWSR